jgi:hypothetical protein
MKAQWDERDGRTLLGDNTSGGAVILRPIRFQCVAVRIWTGLPFIYMYKWSYIYLIPTCGKLDLHRIFRKVSRIVSVPLLSNCAKCQMICSVLYFMTLSPSFALVTYFVCANWIIQYPLVHSSHFYKLCTLCGWEGNLFPARIWEKQTEGKLKKK